MPPVVEGSLETTGTTGSMYIYVNEDDNKVRERGCCNLTKADWKQLSNLSLCSFFYYLGYNKIGKWGFRVVKDKQWKDIWCDEEFKEEE